MPRAIGSIFAATTLCLSLGCGGVEANTECTTSADCFEHYACDPATSHCLRACSANTHCLNGQHCAPIAGQDEGVCRAGSGPGTQDDDDGDD